MKIDNVYDNVMGFNVIMSSDTTYYINCLFSSVNRLFNIMLSRSE